MDAKQVIVVKKFKSMRTGKYCAQASHASVGALLSLAIDKSRDRKVLVIPLDNPAVEAWVNGNFKKVTVYVETEDELILLYEQAAKAGLPVSLIQDAGHTEFHGVPTITCIGIGPGEASEIDAITGHLPLF
jgi:peptidyl-tRNA hydrolase, PTH2 family